MTSDTHTTNARLTELEIKAAFTEDLLDKLDQVIIRQQGQIDALTRELLSLRERSSTEAQGLSRNPRDELPPHY